MAVDATMDVTGGVHKAEPTPSSDQAETRHAQIDGLRALAMLGVLYVHFWNSYQLTEHLRVSLFFVVSGFLITHILYRAKTSGRRLYVLNFYIRRALRLFPALLVLVGVAVVFDADGIRSSFSWHALQMSNIYFSIIQAPKPWVLGHLWSLNVLEQSYLLWPLIILLLPIQRIYVAILALIASAIFVRTNASHLGIDGYWTFFVWAYDPIASGALAYLLAMNETVARVMRSAPALIVSLVVFASPYFLWEGFGKSETYHIAIQPALCCVVVGAFHGYGGLLGRVLESRAARFLSKISYGVFMYHLMIWWLVAQVMPEYFRKDAVAFLLLSLLSIIAATASWYLIEEPISRLKVNFPTSGPRLAPAEAVTT
jgi:peptidoglycan/LPS O-acetylase OafA/YrhL